MSNWQPIETAPKSVDPDGRVFTLLGFLPDEPVLDYEDPCDGIALIWWDCVAACWFAEGFGPYEVSPSHWMDLPKRPVSA